MSHPSFLLVDVDQNIFTESQSLELESFRIDWFPFKGGVSDGVWALQIRNQIGSATWLATRGMSLYDVHVGDTRFGWRSPVRGPVHPQWVNLGEPSGLGWLDGFDELLVRCGLDSNGAPQFAENGNLEFGLHGRIGNLPVRSLSIERSGNNQLLIHSVVEETRFHFSKWRLETTTMISDDSMRIETTDRVTNLAGTTRDCQLLYHFNLGQPLLNGSGSVHVPLRDLEPRDEVAQTALGDWQTMTPPEPNYAEQVFFGRTIGDDDGRSLAVATDGERNKAGMIEFAVDTLPCFSVWKNCVAFEDGYVVGLEPATNFPNSKRVERAAGRTVSLEPGASESFEIAMDFSCDSMTTRNWLERVERLSKTIA
ncbi:MAG: DUF4432 family protein [Pirellulaceae bacterium]